MPNCDQCDYLFINGVGCHETGCPNAWKDTTIACFECGCDFVREERFERICKDCREFADELHGLFEDEANDYEDDLINHPED